VDAAQAAFETIATGLKTFEVPLLVAAFAKLVELAPMTIIHNSPLAGGIYVRCDNPVCDHTFRPDPEAWLALPVEPPRTPRGSAPLVEGHGGSGNVFCGAGMKRSPFWHFREIRATPTNVSSSR
jgi:hypothetical protein